jgi:predicted GNAT family acetyltransferase
MTIDEVEALIKTKTRNKARIHRLEERVGDSVAFLSYSIDDKNQMTIWHTEIPPSLQHMGIGGKLVEEVVQLASRDSSRLRIVCPFAKEHLARHPELIEAGAAKILIDPFLSDNLSRDNGRSGYLTGKNSTQGGDL